MSGKLLLEAQRFVDFSRNAFRGRIRATGAAKSQGPATRLACVFDAYVAGIRCGNFVGNFRVDDAILSTRETARFRCRRNLRSHRIQIHVLQTGQQPGFIGQNLKRESQNDDFAASVSLIREALRKRAEAAYWFLPDEKPFPSAVVAA